MDHILDAYFRDRNLTPNNFSTKLSGPPGRYKLLIRVFTCIFVSLITKTPFDKLTLTDIILQSLFSKHVSSHIFYQSLCMVFHRFRCQQKRSQEWFVPCLLDLCLWGVMLLFPWFWFISTYNIKQHLTDIKRRIVFQ